MHMLDLVCRTGVPALSISTPAGEVGQVVGINLSPPMIAEAPPGCWGDESRSCGLLLSSIVIIARQ